MSTDIQQEPAGPGSKAKRIPRFLGFSIGALVVLTLLTIGALFVDTIEEKGTRIFFTFLVFGVFVGLTALDTLKGSSRQWYPPAALVSNGVFLGASLLTIWLSKGESFLYGPFILTLIFAYAVILRLAIFLSFLAMNSVDKQRAEGQEVDRFEALSSAATAWFANISAAIFVSYIALREIVPVERTIDYSRESVGGARTATPVSQSGFDQFLDIYLKIGTAALILTGLFLSISLLLRWFFGADSWRAKREANAEALRQQQLRQQAPQHSGQQPQQPLPPQQPQAQQHRPESGAKLPWPRFADGTPYPVGGDGQPDFRAAQERNAAEARGWRPPAAQ